MHARCPVALTMRARRLHGRAGHEGSPMRARRAAQGASWRDPETALMTLMQKLPEGHFPSPPHMQMTVLGVLAVFFFLSSIKPLAPIITPLAVIRPRNGSTAGEHLCPAPRRFCPVPSCAALLLTARRPAAIQQQIHRVRFPRATRPSLWLRRSGHRPGVVRAV